jgi:hypothetical protein
LRTVATDIGEGVLGGLQSPSHRRPKLS